MKWKAKGAMPDPDDYGYSTGPDEEVRVHRGLGRRLRLHGLPTLPICPRHGTTVNAKTGVCDQCEHYQTEELADV